MNDSTAEISAARRRFLDCFAANDLAGIASCYTEDAKLLAANMEPIYGRAAIRSVFKFTAVQGHRLDFETHELDCHGEIAVEVGGYVRRRADGSMFDSGNYMVVWKRVDGAWLFHRDMFSSNLPRPALAAA